MDLDDDAITLVVQHGSVHCRTDSNLRTYVPTAAMTAAGWLPGVGLTAE